MIDIPNLADASFPEQARLYSSDVAIMTQAASLSGVKTGCEVTAQGSPNMTLAVASGTLYWLGAEVSVTSGNVTITTAHASLPRIDLVVASSAGVKSVTAGTPATVPVQPALGATSVALAQVFIPAADTAIGSTQIKDRRNVIVAPLVTGLPTIVFKASNETGPNTTVLQNDDDLNLTGLVAGTYLIEGFLFYTRVSGGSSMLKIGFTSSDGSATFAWAVGAPNTGVVNTESLATSATGQTTASGSSYILLSGKLVLTTTANLQLQWANSTGTDPITMYAGSLLRATLLT